MSQFKPNVERWRDSASKALNNYKVPLPVDLVLSIIRVESNGKPGIVNPNSGASGLMQVMPVVVSDYNKAHGTNHTMSDVRSKHSSDLQIKIGVWVLARFYKAAYNYLLKRLGEVPLDQLVPIADLFYAAGPGATRKRLEKLPKPTYEALKAKFPNWQPYVHQDRLFQTLPPWSQWDMQTLSEWLHGGVIDVIKRNPRISGAVALLMVAAAMLFLRRKDQ